MHSDKGSELRSGRRERQERMYAMSEEGMGDEEIAEHFGFKVSTVHNYISLMRREAEAMLSATLPESHGCPYCRAPRTKACTPNYIKASRMALSDEEVIYTEATVRMLNGNVVDAGPCTFMLHRDGKQARHGVCMVLGREVKVFDAALYATRCWQHELDAEFRQVRK